jgi:hypothetical protein
VHLAQPTDTVSKRVLLASIEPPNLEYACPSLYFKWNKQGGDWIDNDGHPFATALHPSYNPGTLSFNVKQLVSRLLADNTGFFVHLVSPVTSPTVGTQATGNPPTLTSTVLHVSWLPRRILRNNDPTEAHLPVLLKFDLIALPM